MRDAKPTPRSLPLLARRLDSSRVGTYMPCLPGVVIRRGRHRARSMTGKTSKGPKELQRECQGGVRPAPWAGVPDRKSTRLNSSHSQISYAVFCLKKKKSTCRVRHIERTELVRTNRRTRGVRRRQCRSLASAARCESTTAREARYDVRRLV